LCWFLLSVCLLFASCCLTILLYYTACLRYEADFVPALTLLAVAGILGLERALANRPAWRWGARCGWGLLLAFSLLFNLSAALDRHAEIHAGLASLLLDRGQPREALSHLAAAVRIRPDDAPTQSELGIALFQAGEIEQSISHFQRAIELQPGSAEAHNNLGNALRQKGLVDESIRQFRSAVQIEPSYAEAHHNWGVALLGKGLPEEAIYHFEQAVLIDPNLANDHQLLGDLLVQKGRPQEAIAHYEAVLRIQPANLQTLNNLAWVLATSPRASVRDGARALELARQAGRLSEGRNPAVLETLAAAFAEAGKFAEAVATVRSALELAAAQANAPLAEELRAQIKLYEAGSPFREGNQSGAK
jgi:tetratricopeptide (TPR) repeat protein